MALSIVQAKNTLTATGTATTVTITTTIGSLIVIFTREGANNTSTAAITDSASQTGWTQTASGYAAPNTSGRMGMFWRANSAALTSVTATWSGALSTNVEAVVFEISGAALVSPEDTSVNSVNAGSVTSLTSGTFTTTNANDALVYGVGWSANTSAPTAGAGYTIPTGGSNARCAMQGQVVSSIQTGATTSMSWTTATSAGSVLAAFKAAAAFQPDEDFYTALPRMDISPPVVSVWG